MMARRQSVSDIRNIRKALLLRIPTQLLSQGQWWSNLSTHRLQIAQWRERGVRSTRQSGHISQGWILVRRSRKSCWGRKYPGSRTDAMKKLSAMHGLSAAMTKAKYGLDCSKIS